MRHYGTPKQTGAGTAFTGYLGSGKTTLLNRILANRKGIKFAVIVNDIGSVNIDASLIEKGGVARPCRRHGLISGTALTIGLYREPGI